MAYAPHHGRANTEAHSNGMLLNRIFAHLQAMRDTGGTGQGGGPGIAGEIAPHPAPGLMQNLQPQLREGGGAPQLPGRSSVQFPGQPPHQGFTLQPSPDKNRVGHRMGGGVTPPNPQGFPFQPAQHMTEPPPSQISPQLLMLIQHLFGSAPTEKLGGGLRRPTPQSNEGVNDAVHLGNGLIYSPTRGYINANTTASNGPF